VNWHAASFKHFFEVVGCQARDGEERAVQPPRRRPSARLGWRGLTSCLTRSLLRLATATMQRAPLGLTKAAKEVRYTLLHVQLHPTDLSPLARCNTNRFGFGRPLPPTCEEGPKSPILHHTSITLTRTLTHRLHLNLSAPRPRNTPLGPSFAPSRMEYSRASRAAPTPIRRVPTPPPDSALVLRLSLPVALPLASAPTRLAPRSKGLRLPKSG
jgi:hypothetical protein